MTNVTSTMPSPPAAGDDGLRLNSSGLTWEPLMSTGMRARMATMRMRRKMHQKPMMDQHKIWRAGGILEPQMLT